MLQPRIDSSKGPTGNGSKGKGSASKPARPAIHTDAPTDRNLKKHVAAIHTDGQLSLLQRKLSNVLLVNAYDALLTQAEHEIDEKTLCVMLGYDSNDRKPLKKALKALASINAEWDILDDDGGEVEWGVASLLSHAVLSRGRCRYGYAPTLAEKLYNPAIYASINMEVQRQFRSGHALALYENCYRFKKVGSTGWWPIQTFRRLLGVGESEYYKSFKHLNAKIIKPVTKEINTHSDIEIEPEFKKSGRSISEIRFLIRPNGQMPLIDMGDDDSLKGTPIYERLIALGVSHKLATQWITSHGEPYVREKLDYADAQRKGGKIRGSVTGFLNAAITEDYQTAKVTSLASKRAKSAAGAGVRETQLRRQAAEKAQSDARAKDRQAAREAQSAAADWLEQQPDRDSILVEFAASLTKPSVMDDYAKGGIKAPLAAPRFAEFVKAWREDRPSALP